MSKSPLVMYVAMQQRPAARMTRPTPKSHRRTPRRVALRLPHLHLPHLPHLPRRKPAAEAPATPVVFKPANLQS